MNLKTFLPLIFAIFLLQACTAQKGLAERSRIVTRFSFVQLTGGVILLQGQFNNFKDTLSFILDTGSGGISLDSTTVEYFGLKGTPSNRTIKGIAGEKKVSFLYNSQLKFPGITIDSLNFHINDYSLL